MLVEGSIFGQTHWQPVKYRPSPQQVFVNGYLDTSTGALYSSKTCLGTYTISLLCVPGTVVHLGAAMLYNALRIIPVALYILGGCVYEAWTGKEIYPDDPFRLIQIPKEVGRSLWNIVRSPFYALGVIFGLVWSLVDPLNGRKVAAGFELAWNHGVERKRSYWSTLGPQKEFAFEGGGAPSNLGKHGFYLPGCYQPFGKGKIENGKLTSLTTVSGREYPKARLTEDRCTLIRDCLPSRELKSPGFPLTAEAFS